MFQILNSRIGSFLNSKFMKELKQKHSTKLLHLHDPLLSQQNQPTDGSDAVLGLHQLQLMRYAKRKILELAFVVDVFKLDIFEQEPETVSLVISLYIFKYLS